MIQPIYTSVSNADIVPCGKRKPIKSDPIPLLRNNYLGEYRTELERAKVRKNLGIADEQSLLWGNIDGTIEEQKDLVRYIEQKWQYSSDVSEDINTVKDALDYALYYISRYEDNTEEIEQLSQQIAEVKQSIEETESELQQRINENSESIGLINTSIQSINEQIVDINKAIENIDVDKNIQNWITRNLENSKTIKIEDSLEVIISDKEDNAIHLVKQILDPGEEGEPTEITLPGLYVKDYESKITEIDTSIENIQKNISNNSQDIENLKQSITYETNLPDETTSTIIEGTTVEKLKGKPFSEIIDTLIFPTYVRDLIYPELYYTPSSQLVEVGSNDLKPILNFIKNDAGEETSREEKVTYKQQEIQNLEQYTSVGEYVYSATVTYDSGEYLTNNKGEVTDKRVEAGSIQTSAIITATYPWFAGNTEGTSKQILIPFGKSSEVIELSLNGRAVIKLPGTNSKLELFKVNGGLGYLDVDLNGWETSTEQMQQFTYKVWTKKDSYSAVLPHQIKFTLVE